MQLTNRRVRLMGTVIDVSIYHKEPEPLLDQVEALLHTYNKRFSANDDSSELMKINKAAGLHPVTVHPELFELISLGKWHSCQPGSHLNIAIGPLIQTWRIGFSDAKLPLPEEIRPLLDIINPNAILLSEETQSVFLKEKGMKIDLGALAKGYIADRIADFLKAKKVTSALINLGGNVLTFGPALHNPDQKWPADRNKQTDFWDFLTGKSSVIEIEVGKYNVIPEYWNSSLKEYVVPSDGSVLFTVYDKTGKKVTAGVKVSDLPGVSSTDAFITNEEGQFKVTWDKLPDNKGLSERKGSVTVTVDGTQETSAGNTLVPNRINVRAIITSAYLSNYSNTSIDIYRTLNVYYSFERQVDGEWDKYPTSITTPYNSMKSARVKDINRPVNEGNVDKDQLVRYSNGNSYLYIIRPLVLTETEKANVAKNDTVGKLAKYEWDQTDNYAALYFGDGTGSYNDYGQTVYLQDKIHVPEVYPAPSFKENSVFIEIKQGITTMWGEIDTDNLQDFYKTYAYPIGQDKFTKEEGTNVWKHPEGKLPASELEENRAVFIEMRTFINGTGGTVHTGSKPLSTGGKRFKLTSTYPNNWIGLDIRRRTESTDKITYNISNEYRGRYAYYLLKEEDKYYLVDFADWSKRMPLPIKDCPVDWMN